MGWGAGIGARTFSGLTYALRIYGKRGSIDTSGNGDYITGAEKVQRNTSSMAIFLPRRTAAARGAARSSNCPLARLIRRSALSEGFLGKTRWFIPRASNRGGIIGSRTLSDALGVGGSGLAGRQRPAASRSGRFQRERDEAERLGLWAA